MVIVGAGFAGMYLIYLLRKLGIDAVALDQASGVGGTWYWNRYPGARCDIESMQYSLQFDKELQQEWDWSERYSAQPEILDYANHVADRHDLRRDICFDRRVMSAHYDDDARQWTLTTDSGEAVTARFCIMATGCLSVPNKTRFAGEGAFKGPIYRTGLWPHEPVDFTGQRVGVIGTGSSAIQSIPEIAKEASRLTVFQRTPNYAVPAHNGPMDPGYMAAVKADYDGLRARQRAAFAAAQFRFDPQAVAMQATPEERLEEYERRWAEGGLGFMAAYVDLMADPKANETAAEFVRGKIRELVDDPAVAELLCPTNTIGCKRLCVDTDYYKTYNLPHVQLVDVSNSELRIDATSIIAGETAYPVDAIVMATGFDAMTGGVARYRHPRPGWAQAPRQVGGRTEDLSRAGDGRLSQPVHGNRTGQPVCVHQHAAEHRTSLRLDHRLHCCDARGRPCGSRGGRGRRGGMVSAQPGRGRCPSQVKLRVLVHWREHCRQAEGVHALYRRLSQLCRQVRGRRGQRL